MANQPLTEDTFIADRQQMLHSFWRFLERSIIAAVVLLILMAVFLV